MNSCFDADSIADSIIDLDSLSEAFAALVGSKDLSPLMEGVNIDSHFDLHLPNAKHCENAVIHCDFDVSESEYLHAQFFEFGNRWDVDGLAEELFALSELVSAHETKVVMLDHVCHWLFCAHSHAKRTDLSFMSFVDFNDAASLGAGLEFLAFYNYAAVKEPGYEGPFRCCFPYRFPAEVCFDRLMKTWENSESPVFSFADGRSEVLFGSPVYDPSSMNLRGNGMDAEAFEVLSSFTRFLCFGKDSDRFFVAENVCSDWNLCFDWDPSHMSGWTIFICRAFEGWENPCSWKRLIALFEGMSKAEISRKARSLVKSLAAFESDTGTSIMLDLLEKTSYMKSDLDLLRVESLNAAADFYGTASKAVLSSGEVDDFERCDDFFRVFTGLMKRSSVDNVFFYYADFVLLCRDYLKERPSSVRNILDFCLAIEGIHNKSIPSVLSDGFIYEYNVIVDIVIIMWVALELVSVLGVCQAVDFVVEAVRFYHELENKEEMALSASEWQQVVELKKGRDEASFEWIVLMLKSDADEKSD